VAGPGAILPEATRQNSDFHAELAYYFVGAKGDSPQCSQMEGQ
jgi:hypothetical protein